MIIAGATICAAPTGCKTILNLRLTLIVFNLTFLFCEDGSQFKFLNNLGYYC
jgi:hypothetical protein